MIEDRKTKMKRALTLSTIAGPVVLIVLTFMFAFSVHATTLPLTDPIIGHWCRVKETDGGIYKRGAWDCKGNLFVRHDGWLDDEMLCYFASAMRLPNGYLIRSSCPGEQTRLTHAFTIVDGLLHVEAFHGRAAALCRVVGEKPTDHYVNLFTGPGNGYVKARLVIGAEVAIEDEDASGKWLRVTIPGLDNMDGWISGYERLNCSKIKVAN